MSAFLVFKLLLYTNSSKVATLLGMGLASLTIATVVISVQKELIERDLKKIKERLHFMHNELGRRRTSIFVRDSTIPFFPIEEKIEYRLPRRVLPKGYNLFIDLVSEKVSGKVVIHVKAVKDTESITLHSSGLLISTISVANENEDKSIPIKGYEENLITEMVVITLSEMLTISSTYVLTIDFECTKKKPRKYGSARTHFPCFDEPDIKVPFKLSLIIPENYTILSTVESDIEKDLGDGRMEVFFIDTLLMSAQANYVLTQKVSSIVTVKPFHAKDFNFRIFTKEEDKVKVVFALKFVPKVINFISQNFNVLFPLHKLDFIGEPDLPFKAVGSFGLTTIKEELLINSNENSSTKNKLETTACLSYEILRIWFGGLVTPKWWNDLWLEQGICNYLKDKVTESIHPEFVMINGLSSVLEIDSTLTSFPIIQNVDNRISFSFERIAFSKGASVLRVIEDIIGSEKLKEVFIKILHQFSHRSFTTEDFLNELDLLNIDKNLHSFVKTWTEQAGYPVIEFEKTGDFNYNVTQRRFLMNPNDYKNDDENSELGYHWLIPLTYITNNTEKTETIIFSEKETKLVLKFDESVRWFKFNINQVGFYRVNYPEENWQAMTSALISGLNVFNDKDRASLLEDAFALADAKQLKYEIPLNLSKFLINEEEYFPWKVASKKLKFLMTILFQKPLVFEKFIPFARNLVSKVYKSVNTWQIGENVSKNLFTVTIIELSCYFGLKPALETASSKFNLFIKNHENRGNPDLREIIYYYGMKAVGNLDSWNIMWNIFRNEKDLQEKKRLMRGLAGTQESWILEKYIQLAWDENNILRHEYFKCLQNISENRFGRSLVWDHIRNNWMAIIERYPVFDRNLQRLILSLTKSFCTNVKFREINAFFDRNPDIPIDLKKLSLSKIQHNIMWTDSVSSQIGDWLVIND